MKKLLVVTFIATFSMRVLALDSVPIIPAPLKADVREGTFQLTRATIVQTDDKFKNEAKLLAERLAPSVTIEHGEFPCLEPYGADGEILPCTECYAAARRRAGCTTTVIWRSPLLRAASGKLGLA